MVYAVATSTIERFEAALGRPVRWPWVGSRTKGSLGDRLRIYPHAMQEPNAYYDRHLRGLLFGYFAAGDVDPGRNLPGQIVYTCLSADIVAHETTHALLDSVQPYFLERTGPDAPAFHEAFADVISLLGHFTYTDALLDTIQRTGGLIQRDLLNPDATPTDEAGRVAAERSQRNPLVDLALQFGESLGNRAALRSALGRRPDPAELRTAVEAHDRGAILVAAIFDAFFSVYLRRIADLLRIGRASGAITASGDIHPDLATRLAREATDTAARISSIAARALDFCPPVDIEFGDYLRALVTADYERAPDDPLGFRAAFIEGFRARGIYPASAWSMTEQALRWVPPADEHRIEDLVPRPEEGGGRAPQRDPPARVRGEPTRPARPRPDAADQRRSGARPRPGRHDVTPARPVGGVAHRVQGPPRPAAGGPARSRTTTDRRRSSSVAAPPSCSTKTGVLKYVISKRIGSEDRLRRQRDYLADSVSEAAATGYRGRVLARASLAALHRGL